MGEMKYGAAVGMKNFVELTLGTGVGSGLMKIQTVPRQITITLFIIINKIVLLDIFVQLIR